MYRVKFFNHISIKEQAQKIVDMINAKAKVVEDK